MQNVFTGRNSINNLKAILEKYDAKSVLLFRGNSSTNKLIYDFFQNMNLDECFGINPNPTYDDIMEQVEKLSGKKHDIIVAFGGGSVLDFAKAYKHYASLDIPVVAIPTTAGTGSEVTKFSVIIKDGVKGSIDDASLIPQYALVDSQFLANSPKYLKACTAIDAYCQSIESYWAVNSNDESKKYAKDSILLIRDSIAKFVLSEDSEAADKMSIGSYLSGVAINISKTTAAHALSYSITTGYDTPHGHAVALSMADLFDSNYNVNESTIQDSRGVDYVKKTMNELLELIQTDNFATYWHDLLDELGLEWRFSKLGISDKAQLAQDVNEGRLANNPVNIIGDLKNYWAE